MVNELLRALRSNSSAAFKKGNFPRTYLGELTSKLPLWTMSTKQRGT